METAKLLTNEYLLDAWGWEITEEMVAQITTFPQFVACANGVRPNIAAQVTNIHQVAPLANGVDPKLALQINIEHQAESNAAPDSSAFQATQLQN